MKIYTKIRIDIDTGEIIEEASFEYQGPVSMAMPSTGGSDPDSGGDDVGGMGDNASGGGTGSGGIGGDTGSMSDASLNSEIDAELDSALSDVLSFEKALRAGMPENETGFWDSAKDLWNGIKNYVGLAFSALTGNIAGIADYGPKALDDFQRQIGSLMLDGKKSPKMAVEEAAQKLGISLSDSQKDAISNSLSEQLNKNGGEGWKAIEAARESAAGKTNTGGGQVAAPQGFTDYESALIYSTGAAAKRADEAWQIYKGTVLPYEQDFYNYAKALLGPQYELSRQYIDSQIKQIPGYTNAALKFYDEAANGVDENQRANQAQAEVEHAYKLADESALRNASRMGLDINDTSVLDNIKTNSLDKARGISGARTAAVNQAEQENFGRLYTAANMRPGGSAGISFGSANTTNPTSTQANQAGLAMQGIGTGLNQENAEANQAYNFAALKQNEPYKPDFGDLLVNTALSGLSKTDWSKIF